MSATQYQPGPTPVPRSRNTMAMVIGAVSFMMALGGIAAVLLTSAGGPSTTPPIDPPVNPPVVPTPTATPDPQGDAPRRRPPRRRIRWRRTRSWIPTGSAPTTRCSRPRTSRTSRARSSRSTTRAARRTACPTSPSRRTPAGKIVIVDRGEKGNWDEAGTCQDGTYVQDSTLALRQRRTRSRSRACRMAGFRRLRSV